MKFAVISATAAALLLSACTTNPYTGEQQVSKGLLGAGTGAAVGAAAGALLGHTTSLKTRKAALVGAGLGALAGGGIGMYMDNQEAKLRQRLANSGVSVTRVGDSIVLNMPSNITFDSDQADVKPAFYDTLNSVAIVFQEYDQTLHRCRGPHRLRWLRRLQRRSLAPPRLVGRSLPHRPATRSQPLLRGRPWRGRTDCHQRFRRRQGPNRRVEITIQPLT